MGIHLEDPVGDLAVRVLVDGDDRIRVRGVGETEDVSVCGVEPVLEEPDPILSLLPEVEGVDDGELLGRDVREIVAIHVRGHPGAIVSRHPDRDTRTTG